MAPINFSTNNWKPVIYVTISGKKKLNICDIGVKFVKGPYGDHRISEKNIPDSITLKQNKFSEQKIFIIRTKPSITYQLLTKTPYAGDSGMLLLKYGI